MSDIINHTSEILKENNAEFLEEVKKNLTTTLKQGETFFKVLCKTNLERRILSAYIGAFGSIKEYPDGTAKVHLNNDLFREALKKIEKETSNMEL